MVWVGGIESPSNPNYENLQNGAPPATTKVLIGDHQQLRPSTAAQPLFVWRSCFFCLRLSCKVTMLRPCELGFSRRLFLEEIGNGKKFSFARMEFTPRFPDYCSSQNTSKEVETVIEARQEFARMSSLGQFTSCQTVAGFSA